MPFEDLPTTPQPDELVDAAFSRAARAGRAKRDREAQEAMLRTACSVVADNAEHVVTSWPDVDRLDPFHRELADAVLRETTESRTVDDGPDQTGVDALRAALSEVSWLADRTRELRSDYLSRIRDADVETARKHREQAFARIDDIVDEVAPALARVAAARDALRDLPALDPDAPAIAVAGAPNVGKSAFVNAVTRASNETAAYPFTTRAVQVGHATPGDDRVRYQVVDTPGVLDRPAAERNGIEQQAVSAVEHLADAVLFVLDASEACGYPVADQLALRDELVDRFDAPVVTVRNKADRDEEAQRAAAAGVDADAAAVMSVATGAGVEDALAAAVDAAASEPDLPPSRQE